MIVIRNYISEIPANLAKAALEGSGISVMIRKDDCGGMRPYLQTVTGVQLIIRKEDAERAEVVLSLPEGKTNEGLPSQGIDATCDTPAADFKQD